MGVLIPIVLVVICCLIIWRASDGFSLASDYIGRNLSEGVRGATINAIGSSLPEVFTSIFFLFYLKDVDGFSGGIGTTAGSAIFNGMIIPAFSILVAIYTGVAASIKVSRKVLVRDGLSLIIAELLFIMIISGSSLYWWHGALLIIIYMIYLLYMFKSMKRPAHPHLYHQYEIVEEKLLETSTLKALVTFDLERVVIGKRKLNAVNAWVLLIVSVVVIAIVCFMLVQACEWIGSKEYTIPYLGTFEGLNIPILFVAVILASAATSVPDTILSMKDARKGNYDDAISNALGSNIFDICFALGFPLLLYTLVHGPIHMHAETIEQSSELRMLLLVLTVASFFVYIFKKIINQVQAYWLLGIYFLFSLYVIGRGANNALAEKVAETLRTMVGYLNLFQ